MVPSSKMAVKKTKINFIAAVVANFFVDFKWTISQWIAISVYTVDQKVKEIT